MTDIAKETIIRTTTTPPAIIGICLLLIENVTENKFLITLII